MNTVPIDPASMVASPKVSVLGDSQPVLPGARLLQPNAVAALTSAQFDRILADSGTKTLRVRIEAEGSKPEDLGVLRVERYGDGPDSLVALELDPPSVAPFELVESRVRGTRETGTRETGHELERLAEELREFLAGPPGRTVPGGTIPGGTVPGGTFPDDTGPKPRPPGGSRTWSLVCVLFRICLGGDPLRP